MDKTSATSPYEEPADAGDEARPGADAAPDDHHFVVPKVTPRPAPPVRPSSDW
jgi:hypothetical protein